jgi:hypothetical protein
MKKLSLPLGFAVLLRTIVLPMPREWSRCPSKGVVHRWEGWCVVLVVSDMDTTIVSWVSSELVWHLHKNAWVNKDAVQLVSDLE